VAPLLERFAAGSGVAKRCYLTVIDLAPADTISFTVCTPGEAMAALIAQERALMAVEARRT